MPIGKYLRTHTRKQHLAWLHWLAEQWNEPDRTDHYLMQIVAEIRRWKIKNPRSVKLDDVRIQFSPRTTPSPGQTAPVAPTATMLQMQKARWAVLLKQPVPKE